MNRKLVGGVVAIVVLLLAAWLLFFRGPSGGNGGDGGGSDNKRSASTDGVKGRIDRSSATEGAMVRGANGRWTLDPDPDGPLRMEGQVTGPDGKGVAGAEVFINSAPPRTVTTADDGSFTIDKL